MIDSVHLTKYVIHPVLMGLGLYSENAERLVLGTACQESQCGRWLKQLGDGPALGIYQCEPATHYDLWENFLKFQPELALKVSRFAMSANPDEQLVGNLFYATAICRVHYYRVFEPIPDNLPGQAAYWKKFYNTFLGKGTIDEYINAWHRYVPVDMWSDQSVLV
jgi:hypothetical protein